MRKKITPLPELTVHALVLIVSVSPSWPDNEVACTQTVFLLFLFFYSFIFFFFNDARPTDFEEKIEGLLTG